MYQSFHRLIPVSKWDDFHSWPTPGALRQYIFHSDRYGFSKVVRRVGRRVLIDEQAFFEWVEEQNGDVKCA